MRLVTSAAILAAVVTVLIAVATRQWSKPRPDRRQMPAQWTKHWLKVCLVSILAFAAVFGSSATAMNAIINDDDQRRPSVSATAKSELQKDAARYFSGSPIDVIVTSYGPMPGTKGAYVATITTYYGGKLVSVVAQKAFMVNGDHWNFGCNVKTSKDVAEDSDGLVFVPLSHEVMAAEFASLGHCPLPTRSKARV